MQDLAESLQKSPGAADEIRPILLPSVPLRERVRVELARTLGLAMGVEFLLPSAFFNRVAEALHTERLSPAWEPEGLFWRLLPHVRDLAQQEGSPLATLGKDEGSVVEMARQLSDRFDQYMHYRPDMILCWDQGKAWPDLHQDAAGAERWQRELWQKVNIAPDGSPHLVKRFEGLKARLLAMAPADWPFFGPLEALTTGPLPKSTLEVLVALGRKGAVNLRMLMPSHEHFRYLQSAKAQRAKGQVVDAMVEGHPLLASLGTQARGSFAILEELLDPDEDFEFLDGPEEDLEGASLLAALQQDIRAARQPRPGRSFDLSRDRSIRVHRCHGAQREVEVLRDELLHAFAEDGQLRAEDVLILSPKLEVHGPLVRSLFSDPAYDLPLALVEQQQAMEDPLLTALCALLRFASGRAPFTEGLGLIEGPAALAVLGAEQAKALSARLQGAGITFGLDAGHRQQLEAGSEATGTWRAGMDRLLEGLWFGREELLPRPADGKPSLPQADELSSGRGAPLQALRWFERLLGMARLWREPAAPAGWALRLSQAAEELFDDDSLERAGLAESLSWLRRAAQAYACDVLLPPQVLAAQLEAMAGSEERRVRPVGGRIALGGLKPLRAMPCKVLALVGLDDPSFPRRGSAPAWDLMAYGDPLPGDRNPREEDRQLFLDALLSAGQKVIITAPVRHLVSNKDLPFSVCIDELLRAAALTAAGDPAGRDAVSSQLVASHPLQAHARENFEGLGSFDVAARQVGAKAEEGDPGLAFSLPQPLLPASPRMEALSLGDLAGSLRSPAEAWLNSLGVILPRLEAGEALDEDPMELKGGLRRWGAMDQELKRALRSAGMPAKAREQADSRALARLQADRFLAYGELGQAQSRIVLGPMRAMVESLMAEGGIAQQRAHAGQGLELWGDLTLDKAGKSLVFATASKLGEPKQLLQAWAMACLAVAAGQALPLRRFGMDDKGKPRADMLPAPEPTAADEALAQMLRFHAKAQAQLLPFEAGWSHGRAVELLAARARGYECPKPDAKDWDELLEEKQAFDPAFALAWRDRNPWKAGQQDEWDSLALELWSAPLEWAGKAQEQSHD